MYRINKQNYVDTLLKQSERIFHTQDLGVLWNISNKNTLYTTISRYTKRGILYPIYKGLYSTLPLPQLDSWLLGIKSIHSYAYVSCETMLAYYGYTNTSPLSITLISDTSKQWDIGNHNYRSRQLKDEFLFNPAGIIEHNGIKTATIERAIADLLYFNSNAYFDKPIDWKKIKHIQQIINYPLTPQRYATTTPRR